MTRMIRLKDIAESAGVSVMTVSKALRDEPDIANATRARMMDKSFVRLPSREELARRRWRRSSRMILLDCGAGISSTGGVRGEPGSGDGGSLRWLTEAFAAAGAPLPKTRRVIGAGLCR